MNKNKLLMIVNEFPPSGQIGVQRPLKFLKYIIKAGWEVYVIAPPRPVTTSPDYSLLAEIPKEAKIFRVSGLGIRTPYESRMVHSYKQETNSESLWEKYFWRLVKIVNDLLFPYDKQIGWMPFACCKAYKLIKQYQIRNVYITAFPFSAFGVGIILKKIFKNKIFWIADYRDTWQFGILFENYVLPFRLNIIRRTDDLVLRTCDAAVFVTPEEREKYISKHPWLEVKSYCITNGYDEDDFIDITPPKFSCLTFVYSGKLTNKNGNPLILLAALKECDLGEFQIVHIGNIEKTILDSIKQAGYNNYLYLGYKSHKEALSYNLGADVNLILFGDDPQAGTAYSGKLFELLRAGKPILALGPRESVLEKVLSDTKRGKYAYINDKEQIKAQIEYILKNPDQFDTSPETIKQYSREELCKQLLAIYEKGQSSNS